MLLSMVRTAILSEYHGLQGQSRIRLGNYLLLPRHVSPAQALNRQVIDYSMGQRDLHI